MPVVDWDTYWWLSKKVGLCNEITNALFTKEKIVLLKESRGDIIWGLLILQLQG